MATNGAANSKPSTLNEAQLCKTTGWHNNCGLNSLTHFMYAKLSAIPSELFPNFLEHYPEYNALLETFKRYYNLNKAINWQDILKLLRDHPVPTDKEAIFAPVLRAHLGKIIAENPDESWKYDAIGAISDYMNNGRVVDVAVPFYASNKQFFDSLRVEYHYALDNNLKTNATIEEIEQAKIRLVEKHANVSNKDRTENYQPTGIDILTNVIGQRKIQLESQFCEAFYQNWLQEGCRRYAEYMANMNNSAMVTAPHLTHLGQALNVGVEVYSPAGLASRPEQHYEWLLKVYIRGSHWTFQEPDRNLATTTQHNRHYEAGRTPEMLGKYKIHTDQPTSKEMVIAEVRCALGAISQTELVEIKQVEQLAENLAQALKKAINMTTLNPSVKKIFEASEGGKEYLELIMSNKDLLKVVNEQYNESLASSFIENYGSIVQKVKALDTPAKQVDFVKRAAVKLALKAPAPSLVTENRTCIKLAYLAIMQQDVRAKQMIERIEKNLDAVALFNGYSEHGVRNFVYFCNLKDRDRLAGLLKLDSDKLLEFLQRLQAMFAPEDNGALKVKPNS